MGKRLSFATRSFGSDGPLPDLKTLVGWVSRRKGQEVDITSFLLEQELIFQVEAGVTYPCAGGTFYFERWNQAVVLRAQILHSGEPDRESTDLARETELITTLQNGVWVAAPAPHVLVLPNTFLADPEEKDQGIYDIYKKMMREDRDASVGGHILIGNRPTIDELEALSMRKVFFFSPDLNIKSLSTILEFQQTIAIRPKHLPLLEELMNQYEVHHVVLLNPAEHELRQALTMKEHDQIECGGYCTDSCHEYWKNLVGKSTILK
jgi:hypothetical protein